MHGANEVDVVHGGGNDVGVRVAIGSHGSGEIDKVHQATAQQIAQGVGVVGQDDLSHLRLGAGHGARTLVVLGGTHSALTPFVVLPPGSACRPVQWSWWRKSGLGRFLWGALPIQFRQSQPNVQIPRDLSGTKGGRR